MRKEKLTSIIASGSLLISFETVFDAAFTTFPLTPINAEKSIEKKMNDT